MLDDAAFDVEAWLAQEIATEFARAEGSAFVAGNGINRPKGFLAGAELGAGRFGAAVRDPAISSPPARRAASGPIRATS